jgi:hypothetical protein
MTWVSVQFLEMENCALGIAAAQEGRRQRAPRQRPDRQLRITTIKAGSPEHR